MHGTRFTLEIQPDIPDALEGLTRLANDLVYTWDRRARSLFPRLDPKLWYNCSHNPKVFLRQVAQTRLEKACKDRTFMEDYHRTMAAYDNYLKEEPRARVTEHFDAKSDLIAYFCAEYGFHESLPIYSGGLGILAGDYCKAASDLGLPFVAIGLLYRQGYFTQAIDGSGNQIAHYSPHDFNDLPIRPALDAEGNELHVHVDMPQHKVILKVWHAQAGHISLYLLDSDLPANSEQDRSITYQLYGGDINTRIQQEIILGIGGVRALHALNLKPSVWHMNEGHAAFMVLERIRELVSSGMDFPSALEMTAASTVFTTHTPVPAGHDIFHHSLVREYFQEFVGELKISMEEFLALGSSHGDSDNFNQTSLALRGSRFHNGVSRIHGRVASEMESFVWPDIGPTANPITYVTNGVHVPSFLAREWVNLFDMHFSGGWRNEMLNEEFWEAIHDLPAHSFWSVRQTLKSNLLNDVHRRLALQYQRNGYSTSQIKKLLHYIDPKNTDILVFGFARRFATYKRATLLFHDIERLARLVSQSDRPVLFLFAGKAHPKDHPGQDLIRQIHKHSHDPRFEGRVAMIEDYDLSLARKLISGVDVWLNTPQYPLEASGTSGQKAGINGVLNLSVEDGWWGEGYNGENGWSITAHGAEFDNDFGTREESNELLDLIEHQVIPLYYDRNGHGLSHAWVERTKASMSSLIPRFNAQRMVMDYVRNLYSPAQQHARAIDGKSQELAQWKERVRAAWDVVSIRRLGEQQCELKAGNTMPIDVAIRLNGLTPRDVRVECVTETENADGEVIEQEIHRFYHEGEDKDGETFFHLDLCSNVPGIQYYRIRVFPHHKLLGHRYEVGRMLWV